MIRLGASTACLYPLETEKALEQMGKLGIRLVEIFYNSPSEYETAYLKQLKAILDYYGMQVISMHPYDSVSEPFMFFTDYERRFRDSLDRYRWYFEQMQILGSRIFVFHGDRYDSRFPEEGYFERFGALSEAGRACGITVAQENVQRCKSRETRFIRQMSRYLGENVHFVLDLKQAIRGEVPPLEMLEAMGDKLVHLHLNDHDTAHDCLLPGKGGFDFAGFLRQVDQRGYDGAALIEVYRHNFGEPQEIAEAIRFLEETKANG